jgi:hypothetical protein
MAVHSNGLKVELSREGTDERNIIAVLSGYFLMEDNFSFHH